MTLPPMLQSSNDTGTTYRHTELVTIIVQDRQSKPYWFLNKLC